ncbi:MAG: tRNA (adenosine(37)-N6)-threonylcarbamoyltransferase complex ATPase subunit type 1 TsaE [Thermoleophilia bacterium]|jgi:tRNA threonylcarbamoyladenosine biosynthesis protein TsaE|nr:tRNA (adenosine(37)-N6)-threonylcarbamoyltransferase complex ATPase subunit type 1 TsaE [Thermoleophilia bacterium]
MTSDGPEATAALGSGLAALLGPGDLVLLRGELGAGKTTLVRAVARALGVEGPVTSPTFTVAQRYAGRVPVAHLDAYRLSSPDDEELGLALEAIGDDAVALVEWPDVLAGGLPEPRLEVELRHEGGDRRLVVLTTADPRLHAGLDALVAHLRARHRHPPAEPRPARGG